MSASRFSYIAILFVFAFVGTADVMAQGDSCSNLDDMRDWKVVVLSNYQSSMPEEKKLAIDAGKKYVDKAEKCRLKDDFAAFINKRMPEWTNGNGNQPVVSPKALPTPTLAKVPTPAATPAPTPAVQYDAALAAKLGADERGMKTYVMCILKTGPKDTQIKGKDRDDIFAGHFANINNLAEQGKLAAAGPFEKNDRTYRGLYIFNVPTIEEAEKLVLLDPAVKAGIFIPELTLWYGSASLMATPEIHKKIQKPKAKTN